MKTLLKKFTLWTSLLATVGLIVVTPLSSARATSIGDLRQQQEELNEQISDSQDAAKQKEQEALTLEKQIKSLDSDISNTEKLITDTNGQISQVQSEIGVVKNDIDKTEEKLNEQIANFNQAVVELYRAGRRSNMEKILGSADLAQAVEQTTYLDSLQEHVNGIVNEITDTKNNLESQKTALEDKNSNLQSLAEQQENQRKSSIAQQQYKDSLLGMTLDQQEAYLKDAQAAMQKVANVNASIERALQESGQGGNVRRGGSGGYPYSNAEPFSKYTCLPNYDTTFCKRNCTDYVAWRWSINGYPYEKLRGASDARNWANHASSRGMDVGLEPRQGAVVVWNLGTYGHVAYVENLNGDDSFNISEYNFSPPFYGTYSTDTITTSSRPSMGTPRFIYP